MSLCVGRVVVDDIDAIRERTRDGCVAASGRSRAALRSHSSFLSRDCESAICAPSGHRGVSRSRAPPRCRVSGVQWGRRRQGGTGRVVGCRRWSPGVRCALGVCAGLVTGAAARGRAVSLTRDAERETFSCCAGSDARQTDAHLITHARLCLHSEYHTLEYVRRVYGRVCRGAEWTPLVPSD